MLAGTLIPGAGSVVHFFAEAAFTGCYKPWVSCCRAAGIFSEKAEQGIPGIRKKTLEYPGK